jgi:hypothetical protein
MLFCLNWKDEKWLSNKKISNKKDSCLFHICMLKPNEDHMNAIHVQMMNQQDFIKLFPLLWISI